MAVLNSIVIEGDSTNSAVRTLDFQFVISGVKKVDCELDLSVPHTQYIFTLIYKLKIMSANRA